MPDNKGMGPSNGNFDEMSDKKEKTPKKGGDFSEKMLKNIDKSISEDKRKELKENVIKTESHPRRQQFNEKQPQVKQNYQKQPQAKHGQEKQPHEKQPQEKQIHEKQPHEKQPQTKQPQEKNDHQKQSHEKQAPQTDKNVEPINPFEKSPVSPFSGSSLPTPDHEVRYKDKAKPLDKKLDEVQKASIKPEDVESIEDQEPINPFESQPPPLPAIEKKVLDDKPLDRRNDGVDVHKERFENKKEFSPEEKDSFGSQQKGEAEERISTSSEGLINPKSDEKTIDAEVQESSVKEVLKADDEESKIGGHVEVVNPDEKIAEKADVNEFKEEFWDILEQAGITKKTILYIVIFLIVIVMGFLFFIFDWYKIFTLEKSGTDVKVEETKVEETKNEPKEISVENPSTAFSIISSYIFGLEYAKPVTPIEVVPIGKGGDLSGINVALIFGNVPEAFKDNFIYYVDIIRRMDAIYHTDIYALLDIAVDRRGALNIHLEEMKALIDEANNAYTQIVNSLDSFNKKFEAIASERDTFENQFFTATDELLGQSSYDYLQSFIDASKRSVEIKAYYNAYKIVAKQYALYLEFMEPRYQDILANMEALIKGVRVFDIPSSDIKAIIELEGQ